MIADVIEGRCRWHVETADVMAGLSLIPNGTVQACVTSPPYWRQRTYSDGDPAELGQESTLAGFVAGMVAVFAEVRRTLSDDGVLMVNFGDCWNGTGRAGGDYRPGCKREGQRPPPGRWDPALKRKDLALVPAAVAQALRADGWYLRQEIIWDKGWASPGSAQDRPVTTHETIYMLSKSRVYRADGAARYGSVWSIPPARGAAGHHAAMPIDLAARCIEISSRHGDVVLDPFAGTGTTVLAALAAHRLSIGLELVPEFATRARERIMTKYRSTDWWLA